MKIGVSKLVVDALLPSYHTAPAHPHATDAAVYTAFSEMRKNHFESPWGSSGAGANALKLRPSVLTVCEFLWIETMETYYEKEAGSKKKK